MKFRFCRVPGILLLGFFVWLGTACEEQDALKMQGVAVRFLSPGAEVMTKAAFDKKHPVAIFMFERGAAAQAAEYAGTPVVLLGHTDLKASSGNHSLLKVLTVDGVALPEEGFSIAQSGTYDFLLVVDGSVEWKGQADALTSLAYDGSNCRLGGLVQGKDYMTGVGSAVIEVPEEGTAPVANPSLVEVVFQAGGQDAVDNLLPHLMSALQVRVRANQTFLDGYNDIGLTEPLVAKLKEFSLGGFLSAASLEMGAWDPASRMVLTLNPDGARDFAFAFSQGAGELPLAQATLTTPTDYVQMPELYLYPQPLATADADGKNSLSLRLVIDINGTENVMEATVKVPPYLPNHRYVLTVSLQRGTFVNGVEPADWTVVTTWSTGLGEEE